MKIIVAIIVYNRYQNLERWLKCWQQCNQIGQLVVIHTGDEVEKFKKVCIHYGIKAMPHTETFERTVNYIHRPNIGFDIGSFQDVCKERLAGFDNDWDYLLWCTDDTFPMTKDFISPFIEKLQEPGVGISCMQLSAAVSPHVRTTGFCITKETSLKIIFPVDPITTKTHCYFFEHRGGQKTFTNQIRNMGLSCEAVAPNKTSPFWDSGYWKRLDRENEHEQVFQTGKKKGDKVTFICTIYNSYPQIISCLLLQTHKNWELILIHDGPSSNGMLSYIPADDKRITYIETKERQGNWGHGLRKWALDEIREGRLSDPDYIVITNADNYHVPAFTKSLLSGFESHTAVASYCESMVHSYIGWGVIPCRFERGFIDCAGVMVKRDIACEIGWRDIKTHSSDWEYFKDIADRYHSRNFIKVPGCLLVHNVIVFGIFISAYLF